MKDDNRTKEDLAKELKKAQKRISELEAIEAQYKGEGQKKMAAYKMAADMIENIPAGVVITDMEGKMIDINRAITEQTGYTKEDIVGQTPLDMGIGKGEQVRVFEALIKMFSGESVIGAELIIERKDGTEYPAIVDISVLKDTEGNPISGIVVLKDISNSDKTEQELDDRELEILKMIAEGTTTREISERLTLSEATIKRDVRNIMEKFGVRNRSEAVAEAYRRNLV